MDSQKKAAAATINDTLTAYEGPWMAEAGVMQALRVSEETLTDYRSNHHVLGLQFSDGNWYYPARQFIMKPYPHVVDGLQLVLNTFVKEDVSDPDTWATWLAGLLEADVTMWDALRAGRLDEVVVQAGRDARWWRQ